MPNPLITSKKLRFFLMDRYPQENYLLDGLEFTDEDIREAFELAVSKFNTTDPMLQRMQFNVSSFPFLYEGMLGIASILLRAKSINMFRNRLGGTGQIVDDKQNAEIYIKLADQLGAEFDSRCSKIKANANVNGGWGRVGGTMESINGLLFG